MNGQRCIRGMRLTRAPGCGGRGAGIRTGMTAFGTNPELEPVDIQQALAFAAANFEDSATERTESAPLD